MASAIEEKELGQCRCCLKNGYHKNIMKEYETNGSRDTYYNMISDCFNLFLSTCHGLPTVICSSCAKQLQQATSFRSLIIESEQKLLNALGNKDTIFVNVPDPTVNVLVKEEELGIKIETLETDEHNGFDDAHFDPDLPDLEEKPVKPVSKSEQRTRLKVKMRARKRPLSAVNKKLPPISELEVTRRPQKPINASQLIPGEAQLLARCGPVTPLPSRRSLGRVYPAFADQLRMLRNIKVTSKTVQRLYEEDELHSQFWERAERTKRCVSEKYALIVNALTLLQNSTLTPFKSRHRSGFPCFICRKPFENIHRLREHRTKSHKKQELKRSLKTISGESFVVYVDVSDLKCTICNKDIASINDLKTHLVTEHKKKYYSEQSERVIPFKLLDNNTYTYQCQCCGFNFETFGAIERHMNTHYRNYICRECGNGFVTKYRLKVHIKGSHTEGSLYTCDDCQKVFQTAQKLKNHTDAVHKMIKRFKCPKCPERFTEYFRRQKHMVNEHGMAPLQYACKVCDKSFDRRYTLSRHVKRDHLEIRDFQCEICSYKCFTKNELITHMIKHNGDRIYECSVCKKSYARKKTLTEHMRIHNNDRRFSCDVCGQAFVQKCSLKGHMKTHHGDYSSQMDSQLKIEITPLIRN